MIRRFLMSAMVVASPRNVAFKPLAVRSFAVPSSKVQ